MCKKNGRKIVALGGFTSIVLEGNLDSFSMVDQNSQQAIHLLLPIL